jgi:hypothetical protein
MKRKIGYLVTDTEKGTEEAFMSPAQIVDYLKKRLDEWGWRFKRSLGSLDDGRLVMCAFPEESKEWTGLDAELIICAACYQD